ncbi:protein of unknown function [Microbacterium sp. Nx66]|nr:protein of unknown function [Microbacterium sp. Nx66]
MIVLRAPGWLFKSDGCALASYPSGQRDLTVNQPSSTSGVRIPHSPPRKPPLAGASRVPGLTSAPSS